MDKKCIELDLKVGCVQIQRWHKNHWTYPNTYFFDKTTLSSVTRLENIIHKFTAKYNIDLYGSTITFVDV